MKKTVRLTESDLNRIVRRILSEQPAQPTATKPPMSKGATAPGVGITTGQPNKEVQQVSQETLGQIKDSKTKFQNDIKDAVVGYFNGCVAILGKEKCLEGLNTIRNVTLTNIEQGKF